MDRCAACGASNAPGVAWCGQCYAALPSSERTAVTATAATPFAAASAGPATAPFVPSQAGPSSTGPSQFGAPHEPAAIGRPPGWAPVGGAATSAPVRRTSRWRKTATTFGPVGRIVSTVCVIVPFLIMLIGGLVADVFALGGAVIWGVIIAPWALKDIWRAGQLPCG